MDTNEVTTDVVEKSGKSVRSEAYEKGDSVTTKYKAENWNTDRISHSREAYKSVCEARREAVRRREAERTIWKGNALNREPVWRDGCQSNSKNVPFPEVLDAETGKFKGGAVKASFQEAGMELDNQIEENRSDTCGTGVTACILTLGMHEVGRDDVEVYDGSWCEWGSRSDVPVKTASVYLEELRRNRTLLYNVEGECSIEFV